uniref:Uncharacterized protein n=1 Tax=viral metagenome TaxID=1070528 RepID=A0A6H1ZLC0_9ZZZZ
MSISNCPHCNSNYDQDYNVEHEEECESNPENSDEEPVDHFEETIQHRELNSGLI